MGRVFPKKKGARILQWDTLYSVVTYSGSFWKEALINNSVNSAD
jgi:hypothetical protein